MSRKDDAVMKDPIVGVSPAYCISRFNDRFSPEQMATGLEDIAAMGYGGFQPEVFHRSTLSDWQQSGSALVAGRAKALGLRTTQFVAHFMLRLKLPTAGSHWKSCPDRSSGESTDLCD